MDDLPFPPVMILAGGMGTRIRLLLGDDLPKSMVPVKGRPFIERQLELLSQQDAHEVILCVGHLAKPLMDHVGDGRRFGVNVSYSFDGDPPLGTGGAVKNARKNAGAVFAVLYGDSYLDVPFPPIYDAFCQSKKKALMTVFRNENRYIKSNILFEDGIVKAYVKSDSPPAEMKHVDFGLSIYRASVFDEFDQLPLDLAQVTKKLIAQKQLAGYEVTQRFYEVGTPEGVRDLEEYLS